MKIKLETMTPEHHPYIWNRLVNGHKEWKASLEYRESVSRARIAVWELNPQKFTVRVAFKDEVPAGFYVLEIYSLDPVDGRWKYFVEEFYSSHTGVSLAMSREINERIAKDDKKIHEIYCWVYEGNSEMVKILKLKGWKPVRTQYIKENPGKNGQSIQAPSAPQC